MPVSATKDLLEWGPLNTAEEQFAPLFHCLSGGDHGCGVVPPHLAARKPVFVALRDVGIRR